MRHAVAVINKIWNCMYL